MHREQISSVPPARHNRKVVTVRKASAELRGTIPSADDRDTAAEETVITVTEENRRTRMKVELRDKERIDDLQRNGYQIFQAASFDCITCNPPYMIGQHGLTNPEEPKAIARHEVLCTLEDVVSRTAKLLKPGGHFYMVHRPFRLAEIMTMLVKYKLEPKRMQLVYPYIDKEPNMVLIEAVRGGKPRMTVEKPLIVYQSPGVYMPEIYDMYGY